MEIVDVDVLVSGGGAAGVCAAIAAARRDLNVLLVESQGCLGGSRTAVGVDTFYGFYTPGQSSRRIVGGIAWEIIERLKAANACFERPNTYGAGTGITYDVEKLKRVFEDMVIESGAKLLFHTLASEVHAKDGSVEKVIIANKAGLTEVRARYYIDTTGDADIAARAGAPFVKEKASVLQSLTTIFFMANVDTESAGKVTHGELVSQMQAANQSGEYRMPREDGSWHKTPNPGVIQTNMVRVPGVDATDPYALSLAEVEGRRQTEEYVRFLKDKVPGFEQSFLIGTSQHIGVRETRKITGEYQLTEQDVLGAAKFNDAIACCGAPIEDHQIGTGTRWVYVQDDGIYHIPYRSLVPRNLNNLIVAGRCLSATHEAQASARNSSQCMAMGQAAGTAAALCIHGGLAFRQLDSDLLRSQLLNDGAVL